MTISSDKDCESWSIRCGPLDTQGWFAVLGSVSAVETYRTRHKDGFRPGSTVDFLVLEPAFAALIRYTVGPVEDVLWTISGSPRGEPSTEAEDLVGRCRSDLHHANAKEINLTRLHNFLLSMPRRCTQIGNVIT